MFDPRIWDESPVLGGWDFPMLLAVVFTTITAVLLLTRLTTGNRPSQSGGSKPPPSLPYWIPYLGHLPRCLYDINTLLQESKKAFSTGIFAIFKGSQRHIIIYSPNLIQDLFQHHNARISGKEHERKVWRDVFDVPKSQVELYQQVLPELQEVAQPHLEISAMGQNKIEEIMRHLEGNIPDIVTFNPSMVDQEPWERVSAVRLAEDLESAEVSLLPLVFVFLTHMTADTILTDSILSDSDHHEIAPLLLAFIQSYSLLETGMSRFIPHPTLPGAHITRQRLFKHLDAMLDVVEDKEMQGPFLAERESIFTEHNAPANIRTSDLLRVFHELNMPHVLTFWALLHIISDKVSLGQIRDETSKFVKVTQEAQVMGFSVPPRMSIDGLGLMSGSCPILDSCLLEASRMYSRRLQAVNVTNDFEFEGDARGVFKTKEQWKIQKGDKIDIPYWLANNDNAYWHEAGKWEPERHLTSSITTSGTKDHQVEPESRAFGLSSDMDRLFAFSFIAGLLALWDIDVIPEKSSLPKAQFAAGVALPAGDFRVTINRRAKAS